MSRQICNLKNDCLYEGNDIGRRIESRCAKRNIDCPVLTHGVINEELRKRGIMPAWDNGITGNGHREKYLGRDVIPFVKEFIKTIEDNPKQLKIESLCKAKEHKLCGYDFDTVVLDEFEPIPSIKVEEKIMKEIADACVSFGKALASIFEVYL